MTPHPNGGFEPLVSSILFPHFGVFALAPNDVTMKNGSLTRQELFRGMSKNPKHHLRFFPLKAVDHFRGSGTVGLQPIQFLLFAGGYF